MADINLVISIPKDSYKATCRGSMLPPDVKNVIKAIKNGTPLPKGHGKIVDANRVLENGDNWEVETALMQTEAIIEADKESEE